MIDFMGFNRRKLEDQRRTSRNKGLRRGASRLAVAAPAVSHFNQ